MTEREKQQRLRLFNRASRLKRLLELNAPAVVIVREAALIAKAGLAINVSLFSTTLLEDYAESMHQRLGYCTNPGCETTDSGKISQDPLPDDRLNESYCSDCRAIEMDLLKEMDDLDKEADDFYPQEVTREDLVLKKKQDERDDETVAFMKTLGLE